LATGRATCRTVLASCDASRPATGHSANGNFSEGEDEKVVVVNAAYIEQHVPCVRDRLKRAGVRLADLLNRTLGQ